MKSIINKSNNFYFTESINNIINKKIYPVNYQDIKKKFWIEIDDKKDLILARKKIKKGTII